MAKEKSFKRRGSVPRQNTSVTKNQRAAKPAKPTSAGRKGSKPERDSKTGAAGAGKKTFPLVGVGASAGGLEAFTQLLTNLPRDPGMAFVLVQHLDPTHESMLTEILSRSTKMPVKEVRSGMPVQPDNVYVSPPSAKVSLTDGRFRLVPRARKREREMPIDYFFQSLAELYRSRAIGVILSGTLSDGALGLKAIKAEGGVTFAQEENSARFPDMPRAAVAAGAVDFVLPPEGIARELAQIGRHPYVSLPTPKTDEHPLKDSAREKVFSLLQQASGVDFRHYRPSTIRRRIARRMVLNNVDNMERYIEFLKGSPSEVNGLYEDILITVTGFFRDPETFKSLKEDVFPAILSERPPGLPVRVWVPGCSTGEEAYSIAITLFESLSESSVNLPVQIFATDISDHAIEKARDGVYLENAMVDVSPERRLRFFSKVDRGYRISKAIRNVCVFARQNLAADPPFSNLDLVSCRNLLIYLEPVLQKRIFPLFHYSLKPGGFLMLGNSESVGSFGSLFTPVDRKRRIFVKNAGAPRPAIDFTRPLPLAPAPQAEQRRDRGVIDDAVDDGVLAGLDLARETDRLILNRYSPAGVVVNDALDVILFRGRVSPYLEPSPGSPSFNILKMAREGLLVGLRSALEQARREGVTVRAEDVRVRQDGAFKQVNIEVVPIRPDHGVRNFLVLFEDSEEGAQGGRGRGPEAKTAERRGQRENEIARLEQELSATREFLQAHIEEQEASNEELKSANEEILSANEELQSTNEELETAKEELQSTNEELTTVNEELQVRNAELALVNNDLSNLLSAIDIPIVMLDLDGNIRRFTPQVEKLLNVIPTDLGRPIHDIKPSATLPDLERMIQSVIDTASTRETEVQDNSGQWYLLRARPYWTMDKRIDGAVLMFLDIDPIKRSSLEQVNRARDYAQALVETVRESLVVLDAGMRVRTANNAFYKRFQTSPLQTEGRPLFELSDWSSQAESFVAAAREVDATEGFKTREVEIDFEGLGRKTLLLNARQIRLSGEPEPLILLAIDDITERKAAELDLRASEARYRQLFESAREGILIVDAVSGIVVDVNPFLLALVQRERKDVLGLKVWELPFASDPERWRIAFKELSSNGFSFDPDLELESRSGHMVRVEALSSVYYLGTQKVAQYNLRDITARRVAEEEARRQKDFTARVVDSGLDGILAFDRDKKLIVWNLAAERIFGISRDEALGRNVCEVLSFFEQIGERQYVEKAIAGETIVSEDRPYVTRSGRSGFFEAHYSPLRDDTGKIIGGLAAVRDITSRKQFEEHLRQVQKLESLGTLSGGIAHDFNNILNIISAYTALLARDNAKKSAAHLETINKAVERGASLTRHLLTFARRSDVQFERVNINETVEELARLLRETFPKKYRIRLRLGADVPEVAADPNQIHQALLNLCVNARDAMPVGGTLTLTAGVATGADLRGRFSEARDIPHVFVSVADTGQGIEEAVRDRLFEPFFTTKDKGRGAGLGLALVYGIVKTHVGFIDVDSQVGKGTEFRIFLPVEPERVASAMPLQAPADKDAEKGGSETILFAEDEVMLASAVQSLLESEGYSVLTAKDGEEALQIFRERKDEIAISILDLQMPRLDGWETFLKMREVDPEARVVIASGDLDRQQLIDMRESGIEGSIRKPYSAGQVMRTVRGILDR